MNRNHRSNYIDSVARVLSQASAPMTVDALMERVEMEHPVEAAAQKESAKRQKDRRQQLRADIVLALQQLYQAIPLDSTHYGWLSNLLRESVFRHPLTNDEVQHGYLLLDELEHAVFFPEFFQNHQPDERTLNIELFGSNVISAWSEVERKTWSLHLGADFTAWVDEQGGIGRDDLLISVIDAVQGKYQLRLQPREARDDETVRIRNMQLAQHSEQLIGVASHAESGMPIWRLAALLVGRGLYQHSIPPDELHYVLHKYSNIQETEHGYLIHAPTLFDINLAAGDATPRNQRLPERKERSIFDFSDDELIDWLGEDADRIEKLKWGELGSEDQELCEGYSAYLVNFEGTRSKGDPLSHEDFHLLEAELETLVNLEQEFGYLLAEQYARKEELAARLFIDPDSLIDQGWDDPDMSEYDGPPFWQN